MKTTHFLFGTTPVVEVQVPETQAGAVWIHVVPACRQEGVPQSVFCLQPDDAVHRPLVVSHVPLGSEMVWVRHWPERHHGVVWWQMGPSCMQEDRPQSASFVHFGALLQVPLVASHVLLGTDEKVLTQEPPTQVG